MEGGHRLGAVSLKGSTAPQDRQAVGMAGTGAAQQLLERHLLGLVLTLSQLLEHHLPFHGEVVAVQAGLQHQIQQQRKRLAGCFRWNQHVEMHVVEAGSGVAAAAQGLNAAIELARRQLTAALEHHVFQKMGHARFGGCFAGAASPAPEIEAHHGGLRQIQLHQGDTVPKSLPLRLRQRAA